MKTEDNYYLHSAIGRKDAETPARLGMIFLIKISVLLLLITAILGSCSKDQQELILDNEYLTVADILQYCQGSCDQTEAWENQTAWVYGNLRDAENDNQMQENYSAGRFFLIDIRNGMFMEIQVTGNKDAIFEKINIARKEDIVQVKGTLNAVMATDDSGCKKGVLLLLGDSQNIRINSQN